MRAEKATGEWKRGIRAYGETITERLELRADIEGLNFMKFRRMIYANNLMWRSGYHATPMIILRMLKQRRGYLVMASSQKVYRAIILYKHESIQD